jgi:hypothetical protein
MHFKRDPPFSIEPIKSFWNTKIKDLDTLKKYVQIFWRNTKCRRPKGAKYPNHENSLGEYRGADLSPRLGT